jgi:hypothetical protein
VATVQETIAVGDTPVTAALSDDAGGALVLELTDAAGASILRLRATPGAAADPDVPWMVPWTIETGTPAAMAPAGTLEPTDDALPAALTGLTGQARIASTGYGVDVQIVQDKDVAADISAERYPDGSLHLSVDPSDLVVCD